MPYFEVTEPIRIMPNNQYTHEVWLDESGFNLSGPDNAQRTKNNFANISGLLWPIKGSNVRELCRIKKEFTHCNEIENEKEKSDFLKSVIDALQNNKASYVSFENTNANLCKENNSFLYLRVLSTGIIKLINRLKSKPDSEVNIKFIIAQRGFLVKELKDYLVSECNEQISCYNCQTNNSEIGPFAFQYGNSLFTIELGSAKYGNPIQLQGFEIKYDPRLSYADCIAHICFHLGGARGAIYNSFASVIRTKSYIFPLRESNYFADISTDINDNRLSDAIFKTAITFKQAFLAKEYEQTVELIEDKVRNSNYRTMKLCLKLLIKKLEDFQPFASSNTAFAQDIQSVYDFTLKIQQKTKTSLSLPWDYFEFKLGILQADCYMKDYNMPKALNALKTCERYCNNTADLSLELLADKWVYYEKLSLLQINTFHFTESIQTLNRAKEEIFSPLMQNRTLRSEYYGDALCMQIWASLPLLRSGNTNHDALRKLSNEALHQYPKHEGELERHYQYRSFIEADAGNIIGAINWLGRAKLTSDYTPLEEPNSSQLDEIWKDEPSTAKFIKQLKKNIGVLLKDIQRTETPEGKLWYYLYYLLIVEQAAKSSSFSNSLNDVKDIMLTLLYYHMDGKKYFRSLFPTGATEATAPIPIHPIPTICWKLDMIESRTDYLFRLIRLYDLIKKTAGENMAPLIRYYAIFAYYISVLKEKGDALIEKERVALDKMYDALKEIETWNAKENKFLNLIEEKTQEGQYFEAAMMLPF